MSLKVILDMSDELYASKQVGQRLYYIIRDRVDKYVKENNLDEIEKAIIYEYLIKKIIQDINK